MGLVSMLVGLGLFVVLALDGAKLKDVWVPLVFVGFGVVWILVMTNIRTLGRTDASHEEPD